MNNIGNKHVCEHCGSRFYDLCEDRIICPQCGSIKNGNNKKKIEKLTVDNVDLFDNEYLDDDMDKHDDEEEPEEELNDVPKSNSINTD